jgi:hypothetical protein
MEAGLALLLTFGMCVLVPIGFLAAIVLVAMSRSRNRHAERMAMIDRGLVPGVVPPPLAQRDPNRLVGWATGLVVFGVLWMVSDTFDLSGFGILLTAVGVAYLTRGVLGLVRDRRAAPGEVREGGNP